jgi:hypothetical protein
MLILPRQSTLAQIAGWETTNLNRSAGGPLFELPEK